MNPKKKRVDLIHHLCDVTSATMPAYKIKSKHLHVFLLSLFLMSRPRQACIKEKQRNPFKQ